MNPVRYVCCLVFALAVGSCAQSSAGSKGRTSNDDAQSTKLSRKEVTSIIADTRRIVSPNGIEQLKPITVNGTVQWISIRGKDLRNPILLYLHGGPGSPTMPEDYTFQSPWEDFFTVVQWDQRGAGKSYASNNPEKIGPTMTLPQMIDDAEVVTQYLRQEYGKKKIFLLGHSWGSLIGVELAQRHPEWFYAYIGTGQAVDGQRSEEEGYRFALAAARTDHNGKAIAELQRLAPYPGGAPLSLERIRVQRKWLQYYGGLTWRRRDYAYNANAWTLSPDYSHEELNKEGEGSLFSIRHLLQAMMDFKSEDMTRFRCPIFLFEGKHDYSVSHTLAEQWFKKLKAPEKKLVWFDNSAHMAMQEQPGKFLFHLVTDVRPLAVAAGDGAPNESP